LAIAEKAAELAQILGGDPRAVFGIELTSIEE
jgi:hypothetical protein